MTLKVVIGGWTRPVNPSVLRVVFQSASNGKTYPVKYDPPVDFRLWFPAPGGKVKNLQLEVPVPERVSARRYQLLLHLPDLMPRLREGGDYSIRLANRDVWGTQKMVMRNERMMECTRFMMLTASFSESPGPNLVQ